MGQRLELQALLETITPNVYFQPPESLKISHPCIVYHRDAEKTEFADDLPYSRCKAYQVTVIDRDPDSSIPSRVADLHLCRFVRFFTANNLNHDVFRLYF